MQVINFVYIDNIKKQYTNINKIKNKKDWTLNAIIFAYCWVSRKNATKLGCNRIYWSLAMCSIPYFALMSKGKLDLPDEVLGKR